MYFEIQDVFWDSRCILRFKMYFGIQNVFWDSKCTLRFKMYSDIQNVFWDRNKDRIQLKKNFISQKHIPKSWNASYWNCNEKKIHWVRVVVVAKITVPHSVLYERLLCLFRCQMYSWAYRAFWGRLRFATIGSCRSCWSCWPPREPAG